MNKRHAFGGAWTTDKLNRVRGYLEAYSLIFDRNEHARWYNTFYVDAFAGTGDRVDGDAEPEIAALDEDDDDKSAFLEGSARIALNVEPGFKNYLFIDRSPKRVRQLEELEHLN